MPRYLTAKEEAVCEAWDAQVTEAMKIPTLARELGQRRVELLPRFTAYYTHLRTLPRRMRRRLQRRLKQSLAGVALVLALGQGAVWADTINVDGATCTLINAIVTANSDINTGGCVQTPATTSGADTIVLQASSVHTLTTVNNTTHGPTGLPVVSSEITIEGNNSTILRSGGAPDFRILAIDNVGILTLRQTTISAGISNVGGGILNYGTAYLEESTVSGNSATLNGGGVANLSDFGGNATLTIINSTVSGNSAALFCGGGVLNYAGNGAGPSATLTITNSTVSGNSVADRGGGVCNFAFASGASATLTISNSTVSGNSAANRAGGVYNISDGPGVYAVLTLANSTVSGNSAGVGGGGVGNGATIGAGSGSNAVLMLTNSTVSGNFAASFSGGITNGAFSTSSATLLLARSLISGNTAPANAEVGNNLYGSVVAANANLFGHSGLTTAAAITGFTPSGNDITATSNGTDPTALTAILDTTLQDNGGPTDTHDLIANSPAIDASPVDGDCEPTDQRGVPRPQGPACDIGAVEFTVVPTFAEACGTTTPTFGCTVNGKKNQPCVGTPGKDTILGTNGADVILGLGGDDTLKGGEGDDCIDGGPGNDKIEGQDGDDVLFGGGGKDQVRGDTGDDLIVTDTGDDTVQGDEGNDLIYDLGGKNSLKGRNGNDAILATGTSGTIDGGFGTDTCVGGTTQVDCP